MMDLGAGHSKESEPGCFPGAHALAAGRESIREGKQVNEQQRPTWQREDKLRQRERDRAVEAVGCYLRVTAERPLEEVTGKQRR